MTKSAAISELIAGYDAYTGVAELEISANGNAPATSPYCVSATVSWLASQLSSRITVVRGC